MLNIRACFELIPAECFARASDLNSTPSSTILSVIINSGGDILNYLQ